jgi:hypothetical protein
MCLPNSLGQRKYKGRKMKLLQSAIAVVVALMITTVSSQAREPQVRKVVTELGEVVLTCHSNVGWQVHKNGYVIASYDNSMSWSEVKAKHEIAVVLWEELVKECREVPTWAG